MKQQRDTGTIKVNRKGKCGRNRKTTARYEAVLIKESKLNTGKTSQQLQQDLALIEGIIHDCTVLKRLIEGGKKQ